MPTNARQQPVKPPSAAQLEVLRYLAQARPDNPWSRWVKLYRDDDGRVGRIEIGEPMQGLDYFFMVIRRDTFRALVNASYIDRPHPGVGGVELWLITDTGRRAVEEANHNGK